MSAIVFLMASEISVQKIWQQYLKKSFVSKRSALIKSFHYKLCAFNSLSKVVTLASF